MRKFNPMVKLWKYHKAEKKGHPWLAAKGFLRSAPIGPFFPFIGEQVMKHTNFYLYKNDIEVQCGNTSAIQWGSKQAGLCKIQI
jgi:fumarylpyruvate hydrolase